MTIKNTLDEIKSLLTELEDEAINQTNDWKTNPTHTKKQEIQKRIKHLLKKTNPEFDNSHKLDNDLEDLEQIESTIGKDKIEWGKEKKQLEDDLKKAQDDNTAKEALIKSKDEEIGKKITTDFITKLENLTKEGVKVDDRLEEYDYGRFAWIMDPEGNRIELWEPPAKKHE